MLGGAQSIFTCAFDEAYQIPTETSAEVALRTQQIVAYESGIARTVDPLGGSYFVEWLTDRMEAETRAVIEEIDAYGGVERAIEDGYLQMRIAERARRPQGGGRSRRDGCGRAEPVPPSRPEGRVGEVFRVDPQAAERVREKLVRTLAGRDQAAVDRTLAALRTAASGDDENLMPHLIECCHAYATVGEMVSTLKDCWGEFQEPVRL